MTASSLIQRRRNRDSRQLLSNPIARTLSVAGRLSTRLTTVTLRGRHPAGYVQLEDETRLSDQQGKRMRIRARSGRAVSLLLRRPVSYRGLTFCFECWRARTGCVVMASTAYSVAAGSRLQQRRRGSSVRVGNWQTSRRPRLGCGGRRQEAAGVWWTGLLRERSGRTRCGPSPGWPGRSRRLLAGIPACGSGSHRRLRRRLGRC